MLGLFVVCYIGQSISSGMQGQQARLLQWSCWFAACATMLICYLLTGT